MESLLPVHCAQAAIMKSTPIVTFAMYCDVCINWSNWRRGKGVEWVWVASTRRKVATATGCRRTPTGGGWPGSLALIVAFMAGEVVVGVLARSLALISDAAHMLTDAASIGLALWAIRLTARPAAGRMTYGWKRAEILSAQANGLTLLLLGPGWPTRPSGA